MSNKKSTKCVGWFGRVFGHKFRTIDAFSPHCLRCGMPAGGWR